jgi:hypothetical protein
VLACRDFFVTSESAPVISLDTVRLVIAISWRCMRRKALSGKGRWIVRHLVTFTSTLGDGGWSGLPRTFESLLLTSLPPNLFFSLPEIGSSSRLGYSHLNRRTTRRDFAEEMDEEVSGKATRATFRRLVSYTV